jgi:two-component sensor histidine kinase/tetratricopeptide (TPR) repeat protein
MLLTATAQRDALKQDSLKKVLSTQPNDTNKVNLFNKLASAYIQTNIDSVGHYAGLAIMLATKLAYAKGQASGYLNRAVYYRVKGNYSPALDNLFQSIKLCEKEHIQAVMARSYLEVAQVYKDMSGSNSTLSYINKGIWYSYYAYNIYNSIHDTAGMSGSLNQAGILYRDIGKTKGRESYYDSAFAAYTQAIGIIERSGKGTENLSKLYNNISQVYNEYKKDYNKALDYLFKAIAINANNNNINSLSFNYGNVSRSYLRLHNYPQALLYARKMADAARQLDRPERLRNAYSQLYECFLADGRYDSALAYYKMSDQLDDSLNNVAKTNEVMDLQTRYETGKKESEIKRLQTESRAKNRQIILLITAVTLFAILTACMLWLYHRIKKQRQQIAAQSTRLEVMMKELHHRVKNNLQIVSSLLSLQSYKVHDEEAVLVLKESQQRVQAMSFIHQRLYKTETLTAVNMKAYLTDLAESLVSSYGFDRDEFDLHITVRQEMMDIDKALPIGLIINEIVTNALKYAYPNITHPSLHISLTEEDNHIVCCIKDNGIGIDEQQWKQQKKSFGKQLITALCKQLRAQQQLVVQEGTGFTITIPKKVA